MAYLPPHKRYRDPSTTASTSTPTAAPNPRPPPPPRASPKIIRAADCVSRWSLRPPFPPGAGGDGEEYNLRLEPFPRAPINRRYGTKPLALVVASTPGEGSSGSTAAAVTAIADRFLPDLLAAAERANNAEGAPRNELVKLKLNLVARLGKLLCNPGSSVSLDALRQAAKAGEMSQLRESFYFYTNVPSSDRQKRSMVERMGLDFDLSKSKKYYHVKVSDNQSDSTISCKCILKEDGSVAIHKVELKQVRHLEEDISCLFNDNDLRLMLSKRRILENLDSEVENAVKSLVSAAITDPSVKGGVRWPLGMQSTGGRFSIDGWWHTNYKSFSNETMKLYLRHADRFDDQRPSGEVSDEVTFKLTAISRKLEEEYDPVENSVKEMLESTVQMVWDNALNYQTVP